MQRIVAILFTLLIAAYPFALYFGVRGLSARMLGYGLLAMAIVRLGAYLFARFFRSAKVQITSVLPAIALLLIAILAILHNSKNVLHVYPVLVSACMLIIFGLSLFWPPPIAERIARLSEPNLDATGVRYTRRVTQIWCVFFFANGIVASWTVFLGNEEVWMLYNGLISYLLMGVLMAGEWLVRRRVRGVRA